MSGAREGPRAPRVVPDSSMSLARLLVRRLGRPLLALLALGVGGCGGPEKGPYPMEAGAERDQPDRPVPPGATTRDRLLPRAAPQPPRLTWTTPPGWVERTAEPPLLASFRIPATGGGADGEASLSRALGGVLENVNRWRTKQMGLEPLDEAGVAALPRVALGPGRAVRVDLSGTYTSMSRQTVPGARMLALVEETSGEALVAKFVGPADLVEAQRPAFEGLVASLASAGHGEPPPEPPASTPPARTPGALDPVRLRWDLPKGWTAARPTGPVRVSDFKVEGAPEVEAYLSLLPADSGGVAANVNNWRGQLGAPPLDEAGIAALERFDVLGAQGVWVEVTGTYRGMGGRLQPDALFLGMICVRPDGALFLRLVGPKGQAEGQREAFRALSRSLRVEG